MTKKYYLSNLENENTIGRGLLIINEENIEKEVNLESVIYVHKNDINNFKKYKAETGDSSYTLDIKTAKEYLVMYDGDVDGRIVKCIDFYESNVDSYNENNDSEEEILTNKDIEKFIEQFKSESMKASDIAEDQVYHYWNGSNQQKVILESDWGELQYTDYTEELKEIKEIDYQKNDTSHDTLYELKDGSKALINTSYWQGSGETIYFLSNKITTMEEAYEEINNKEKELFTW